MLALTFALGLFIIKQDEEQGFLQTLLPKPVTRGEYLWGRGLGIFATVSAAWVVMVLEVFLIFAIKHPAAFHDLSRPEWRVIWAGGILLMKWASLVAILLLSTLQYGPIAGGIAAVLLFIGGHMTSYLHDAGTDLSQSTIARAIAWITFVMAPHYSRAFSGNILDPTANELNTATLVAEFIGWAWTYMMINGLWSWWIFKRKDL